MNSDYLSWFNRPVAKRLLTVFVALLILINFFFASWYVLHGDIKFSSDVARDMWIFKEVDQKKFILIGARSSVGGIYHGPMWVYLTYPGYLMGHGNPVFLGWYWWIMSCAFLVMYYFLAKSLFNKTTAYLFVLMVSMYLVFHTKEFINPQGAFFFLPFFFYSFIKYVRTFKPLHLILHILFAGALIQMEMAVGLPLSMLSVAATLYLIYKHKKYSHLPFLLLYLIPLSTYILFDLRHAHILIKNTIRHLGTHDPRALIFGSSYLELIVDRVKKMLTITEYFHLDNLTFNIAPTIAFLFFWFKGLKFSKYKDIYSWFGYFYFGFYPISLLNRYDLLPFYTAPMFSMVFLIFCSFVNLKHKRAFLSLFVLVYTVNFVLALNFINDSYKFIGKDQFSWRALLETSSIVYEGPEKEFGYFVYSPDIFGYGPRYAMEYANAIFQKNGYAFEKKDITYIVNEPPSNNPTTTAKKFKYGAVRIENKPIATWYLQNGFEIDKYLLTPQQQQVPFDFGINPGLFYR